MTWKEIIKHYYKLYPELKSEENILLLCEGSGNYRGLARSECREKHPKGRMGASVFLIQNGGLTYESRNASTLPDCPMGDGKKFNDNWPIPTLCTGFYPLYSHLHKSKPAFEVDRGDNSVPVIRNTGESTSVGINVHERTLNDEDTYAWSTGCITIFQDDIENILELMGVTKNGVYQGGGIYKGMIIIDRSQISSDLKKLYQEIYNSYYSSLFNIIDLSEEKRMSYWAQEADAWLRENDITDITQPKEFITFEKVGELLFKFCNFLKNRGVSKEATVYFGPDITLYPVLDNIGPDKSVTLLRKEEDWYFIEYEIEGSSIKKRGYVQEGNITDVTGYIPSKTLTSIQKHAKKDMKTYTGPDSNNFAEAGSVDSGESITVFSIEKGDYTFIEYSLFGSNQRKRAYLLSTNIEDITPPSGTDIIKIGSRKMNIWGSKVVSTTKMYIPQDHDHKYNRYFDEGISDDCLLTNDYFEKLLELKNKLFGGDHGKISAYYGEYYRPNSKEITRADIEAGNGYFTGLHEGFDMSYIHGCKFYAFGKGTVLHYGSSDKYRQIVVEYESLKGYRVCYLHALKLNPNIKKGDDVGTNSDNSWLGEQGYTGLEDKSSHVHWEIRKNGSTSIDKAATSLYDGALVNPDPKSLLSKLL